MYLSDRLANGVCLINNIELRFFYFKPFSWREMDEGDFHYAVTRHRTWHRRVKKGWVAGLSNLSFGIFKYTVNGMHSNYVNYLYFVGNGVCIDNFDFFSAYCKTGGHSLCSKHIHFCFYFSEMFTHYVAPKWTQTLYIWDLWAAAFNGLSW